MVKESLGRERLIGMQSNETLDDKRWQFIVLDTCSQFVVKT